jgi:hypothetical protein
MDQSELPLSGQDIAALLDQLAEEAFASVKVRIDQMHAPEHACWLMEICRALDFHYVRQMLSPKSEHHMSPPEFTALSRGWNLALGLLLPHTEQVDGVPISESTTSSIQAMTSMLMHLGYITLLREQAEMIRHGMAEASLSDNLISLRMSPRVSIDHFHDRLETDRFKALRREMLDLDSVDKELAAEGDSIKPRMEETLFPWKHGNSTWTMVGYGAEPDIDTFFLSSVNEDTYNWREEAGIHPDAMFGHVSGVLVVAAGMLFSSFYLKHIQFVELGKKRFPEINYPMSLTIWKPLDDLIDSMSEFADISQEEAADVLELFTAQSSHAAYFLRERTPYIPMLVRISKQYLLSPVSSIFRNPLTGVRMFHELASKTTANSLREPRELWMASDLCHLFQGSRFKCIDRPILLYRDGVKVTDIDTAVIDLTTGDVGLFQLKWQDFNTNEVRTQRSKAKNFVSRVDRWAHAVQTWISEFGMMELGKRLGINEEISNIRLFAIGRSAARFQSYGYTATNSGIASCSWPHFFRLRHDAGSTAHVFDFIAERIQNETVTTQMTPIPHEINFGGRRILFEDLWRNYDDDISTEAQ